MKWNVVEVTVGLVCNIRVIRDEKLLIYLTYPTTTTTAITNTDID